MGSLDKEDDKKDDLANGEDKKKRTHEHMDESTYNPEEASGKTCKRCTLINPNTAEECEACGCDLSGRTRKRRRTETVEATTSGSGSRGVKNDSNGTNVFFFFFFFFF